MAHDRHYHHVDPPSPDGNTHEYFTVVHRDIQFDNLNHVARCDCWCRPLILSHEEPVSFEFLMSKLRPTVQ